MRIKNKGRFIEVPLAKRFWEKVNKNGPNHPTDRKLGRCWIWIGATHQSGYGFIWTSGHKRRLRAHRVAWQLIKGRIPNGKHILHSCDNPPCVNPAHTYPGTDAENHRDKVIRGRSARGEKNPGARLTAEQVRAIRASYPVAKRTGPRPRKEREQINALCIKYDIDFDLASRIARRERWKHI